MKLERSLFHPNQHTASSSSHKQAPETLNKFHRAAREGYVDMLCEASRRDTNLANEENGLTPTLLAAAGGHLDALRILVGRGGDPERTTPEGLNALHLATSRNHLNCVSFLVNFGVNMWALDNELHTAKDIAAMEQRKEILDFLDQMMAKQSALNTKQVQKLKEKAKTGAEKRIKQMRKAQLKAIKRVEKDERYLVKLSNNRKLLKAAHSISDIKLVGRPETINPKGNNSARLPLGSVNSASVSNLASISDDWTRRPLPTTNKPGWFKTALVASSAASSSDDSAYSTSSVSSASGFHLSSRASVVTSSSLASSISKQPNFSELTKIEREASNSIAGQEIGAVKVSDKSSSSASSIGARLRGVAGVSRKVQLKRMTLASADQQQEDEPTNRVASGDMVEAARTKLCNVQPAIKLKLQSSSELQSATVSKDQLSVIKWPPAPSMASKPTDVEPTDGELELSGSKEYQQQQQQEEAADSSEMDENSQSSEGDFVERDKSQQRLLTQCLSQLKMRHQEQLGQLPAAPAAKTDRSNPSEGPPSDELIRHRLSAADLGAPLKPSQIRQQRQGRLPPASKQKSPDAKTPADSIGSASSLAQRNSLQSASPPSVTTGLPGRPSQEPAGTTKLAGSDTDMERFLEAYNLVELLDVFERERIDLEALVLLSEEDLKSLNILLGPRRKLAKAIDEHRRKVIARPMYVMVDTPL